MPRSILTPRLLVSYKISVSLFKCNSCGLIYKDHCLTNFAEQTIASHYQASDKSRWGLDKLPSSFIRALFPNPYHSVLEIGPGDASFISSFPSSRYLGITNHDTSNNYFINANGILDSNLSAQILESHGQFDRIYLFDVFEHLTRIKLSFKFLDTLLDPSGQIILQTLLFTPSKNALSQNIWYINVPEHKVFLTPQSMNYIANMFSYEHSSSISRHKSSLHLAPYLLAVLKYIIYLPVQLLIQILFRDVYFSAPPFPRRDHVLLKLNKA